MNKVTVSIIVPVYNVEKYLKECLDSLVHQTLENYEIIVVNDGSPDHSQDIIDEYAKKYPKIVKAFRKTNGGLSDARNFGIEKAVGEYIGFVDSDDYVEKNMFELIYQKAKETDADVVYSSITYIQEKEIVKRYFPERVVSGQNVRLDPYLLYDANSFAWNKIYRRSFWLKNKFQFPIQWFEDSALIYNVLLSANSISCVNFPLYYYRKNREDSIVNSLDDRIFDIFKSVHSIVSFYQDYLQGDYAEYKEVVESLCVRHLYQRLSILHNCRNQKMVRKYLREMYHFLEENFPNYRHCKELTDTEEKSILGKIQRFLFRHKWLFYLYQSVFKYFEKPMLWLYHHVLKPLVRSSFIGKKRKEKINIQKRKNIQSHGLEVLEHLQGCLDTLHITSFADFGTLLGLVREHDLLKHDLDMDVGVFASSEQVLEIRAYLEKQGYQLWRSYYFDNHFVEDSFYYRDIKIDLNYYATEKNQSVTWLFYIKPKEKYANKNDRSIVKMHYSKITETKDITIHNRTIHIPMHPEKLLEEKYGSNWRTPDTKWIYWTSPAATPVDGIGHFILYRYLNYPTVLFDGDEEARKQLQQIDLMILKEVNRICQKEKLTYYLGEGTMLGAIRHQGFIPWDDDIDILMPRDDYEKFLKVAPKIISKSFEVQHSTLIENYWSPFMKIRYLGETFYKQEHIAHLTDHNGPVLDIFPLDSVPTKDSFGQKKQAFCIKFYRGMLSYKLNLRKPNTMKAKIVKFCSYFFSVSRIHQKLNHTFVKYNSEENPYIVNLGSYYSYKKQTLPKEWYGEPRMVKFEKEMAPVPKEAEKILRSVYGDFMKFPPIQKRVIKHHFTDN